MLDIVRWQQVVWVRVVEIDVVMRVSVVHPAAQDHGQIGPLPGHIGHP
jgi:hypothetical protein